tara:strand:- start:118 stop:645 length:528 start_codon:yes stop_codon:yes gene_type:complete
MNCSICGDKIVDVLGLEKEGNNAQPVNDGTCCDTCRWTVVRQARVEALRTWDREALIHANFDIEEMGVTEEPMEGDSLEEVVLRDVLETNPVDPEDQPFIHAHLQVTHGIGRDGIILHMAGDWNGEPPGLLPYACRVVIENIEGKLMVHVWATVESIGNDPTHSIQIQGVSNGNE